MNELPRTPKELEPFATFVRTGEYGPLTVWYDHDAIAARISELEAEVERITSQLHRYRNLAIAYGAPMDYVAEVDLDSFSAEGDSDE